MTWGGLSHQGLLILGIPLKISIKGEIFSYGKLVYQHLYYNRKEVIMKVKYA